MKQGYIAIKGAKEHNLKDISLKIPRNKLVVVTGLSGSGKSSLAFDTIYAEGQRRYVESLSAYARQFLEQLQKPDVEYIEGISPAISIEQRKAGGNPRSTVGTQTEIYDYLRLLFARIGKPHCYRCGRQISRQSPRHIVEQILKLPAKTQIMVLSPLVRGRKGHFREIFSEAAKQGFVRVRVDNRIYDIDTQIDSVELDKKKAHTVEVVVDRLNVSAEEKSRLTDSVEIALKVGKGLVTVSRLVRPGQWQDMLFSEHFACIHCGISFAELQPRDFSFNSPYGACPVCNGLGIRIDEFMSMLSCPECRGARLKKESLAVTINGKSIQDVVQLSVLRAAEFFNQLKLNPEQTIIARQTLKAIKERLSFMLNVGLGYLTLDRRSSTLSGGEAQRIRLATQVGAGLVGVLYILDEPSIGLHQRDNEKLINTLKALRDLGNTLIVVEHDEATIRAADYIIDLGPGAGREGGKVLVDGSFSKLLKSSRSLTAKYLRGQLQIKVPDKRRPESGKFLEIRGAREHNLKNIDVRIPLGNFVCITGVSGSGKSTLIDEILYRALSKQFYRTKHEPGAHERITGTEFIDKVIVVDQAPIGRTPRSNPATYTGTFTPIRKLFSKLPQSRIAGYQPGRFSFNVKGGRCEDCQGEGIKRIEMHFLPDVYVTCQSCKGARFNEQTLSIKYKGRSISDVLKMSVEEAKGLFKNIPKIREKLTTLNDVGLGYIQLGQSATTLSGGEAQRIKLSAELGKRGTGKTLYILDEPTSGLHFADIERLINVLQRLVNMGNTVLVIEHNLEVIKCADYIIDLGPEGGDDGGRIVAIGPPEKIIRTKRSSTGRYLKQVLNR